MSNPTPKTITPNDVAKRVDPDGIDDKRETVNEFMGKLSAAQMDLVNGNGDGWVETSQEVINYFNRQGLGGAKYYIHSNIKVCLFGQKDEIIREMELSADEKMHGTEAGVIERNG